MENINKKVISDFGKEWESYTQSDVDLDELKELFEKYLKSFLLIK